MPLFIKDVIDKLESIIPLSLQDEWDNSGYQIKLGNESPSRIITSLDLTNKCAEVAIKNGANLILTHHPLFFHPLKSIDLESAFGKSINILIKQKICVYSLHTNFDYSLYNTSRFIADKIGIKNSVSLIPAKRKLYKLSVFIPKGYVKKVRDALFAVASPVIGNYENCSYEVRGKGSFKPLPGSHPFIGVVEETSFTDESRLEVLVREEAVEKTIKELERVHPYEEVAFDLYPLYDAGGSRSEGLGAAGDLNKRIKFGDFLDIVQKTLTPIYINFTGDLNRRIKRIGIVSGSGFSFIDSAIKNECDVFISSELSHSKALKSHATGICLIDLSHFDTERYFTKIVRDLILKEFNIPVIENNMENCPIFSYKNKEG